MVIQADGCTNPPNHASFWFLAAFRRVKHSRLQMPTLVTAHQVRVSSRVKAEVVLANSVQESRSMLTGMCALPVSKDGRAFLCLFLCLQSAGHTGG